jgi:hypothetical protein
MLSAKEEPMSYVAELSHFIDGKKLMLGSWEAPDSDVDALQKVQDWAAIEAEPIDGVVHLQVLQNGKPVLTKRYGEQ